MSFSSTYKNTNVSPSSREQINDSAGMTLSQGGCFTHEHGQVLGSELGLMEMTEADYFHLQHLLQAHVEAQAGFPDGPDVRFHPSTGMAKEQVGSTMISPVRSAQAIDLSTSNEDHCLVTPGEKTPVSYGEVPGFVLARIRAEESPAEPLTSDKKSVQNRTRPAARICLEKRFNTMCAETAVLSNFLTILQQSAETQETVMHPPKQKWVKMERANSFGVSSSYVEGVYGPVTNVCGQVIVPKSVLNFHPAEDQPLVNIEKDAVIPAASRSHWSQPKTAKAAPDSAGGPQNSTRKSARSSMSFSQRRERHNSKERERRKRIRLCCDELNTLVPFCDSETDKVTTLQWTTAFLRYITKTYGDTFKEEFQKVFTHEKELFRKSSSGQDPVRHRMDETLSSIPLAAEQ